MDDGQENGEDTPIRPVSSLLSHFENLSHNAPTPRKPPSRDHRPAFLNPQADVADGSAPVVARASIDIPRPRSGWNVSPSPVHTPDTRTSPAASSRLGAGTAKRAAGRPLTMVESPPRMSRTPELNVEAPPSPKRDVNVTRTLGSPDILPKPESLRPMSLQPPEEEGPRPQSPFDDQHEVSSSPRFQSPSQRLSPAQLHRKPPPPPPVNRVERPKIPTKRPQVSTRSDNLVPAPDRRADEAVSPFSTPPGSPEKSGVRNHRPPPPPPFSLDTSPPRAIHDIPYNSSPVSYSADARQLGFSRTPSRGIIPSRDTKPSRLVQLSPDSRLRDTFSHHDPSHEFSRSPQETTNTTSVNDHLADRPTLPPRPPARPQSRITPVLPPRPAESHRPELSPSRSMTDPAKSPPPPPPPRVAGGESGPALPLRTSSGDSGPSLPPRRTSVVPGPGFLPPARRETLRSNEPVLPPPRRTSTKDNVASSSPGVQPKIPRYTNREIVPDRYEEQVPRIDYPDFSYTNRRPPTFRTGNDTIYTKYDTRIYDVCGRYVCTTGFCTNVWDMCTGEQIMMLNHEETIKCLSVVFRPGRSHNDEGRFLWLGMSTGDIHEVNIRTQSIVNTRSPSRYSIMKLYRHKKEIWSLDEEGRILVWPPDETGAPNMQYSPIVSHDRVANPRAHTFSIVVDDLLWFATGKEVRIYDPVSQDGHFHMLDTPLTYHTGEITSGTITNEGGRIIYLGQSDGKVTIYSMETLACLGIVNVTPYKLQSMAVVGDHLWVGYRTGMIYVYDTKTNPWTERKSWLAHSEAMNGFELDPSSILSANRLQVISLGADNLIRAWDGMLEDDWLENRMQERDVEYAQFRELTAAVVTWNAGATTPSMLRDDDSFIRDAVHPEHPPDIVVFGFQELVDLENKTITAKSLISRTKKKDKPDKEHMSRQYRVWKDFLQTALDRTMPLTHHYVLLHTANLIGLFTCVFVKKEELTNISNIGSTDVKRGMGGLHGNKGALILRFLFYDTSICLINCHLAAGQTHTSTRNGDIAGILESSNLPAEPSPGARIDHFIGGGDGTMILDHEICILNGDLNYRIDSMPRSNVVDAIAQHNLPKLLDRDQLIASKRKNPGFRLRSFHEEPITFAPTYKYDVGSDTYDSSEKRRAPAWCDRLQYRGVGRVKQTEYRRHEVRVSDHRPVSGWFKMRVKAIDPERRTTVWGSCRDEFVDVRRRLAIAASVEYLVTGFGLSVKDAEGLIEA